MHPSIARGALAAWSKSGRSGRRSVLRQRHRAGRGDGARPARDRRRREPAGDRDRARADRTRWASPGARGCARRRRASPRSRASNARKRRRPESPPWAKKEFERFHPHVALELLGLRALVMDTPEDDVGHALRLCLSSILVKVMKAGPEAPRDGAEKRIGRGIPSRLFTDRAEELARGLAALERRVPAGTPAPEIRLGDARDLRLRRRRVGRAGGLVAALCRHLRLRRPARRALHLARAAAAGVSRHADRRARRRPGRRPARLAREPAPLDRRDRARAGARRPRDAGGRRRRRRRPGRGRARRGRERRAPTGPGADRARVAGAPGDRQPPAADLRGAPAARAPAAAAQDGG